MKNIILILSFMLCLINPVIVKAQTLSQKEKLAISEIISVYGPPLYNNRHTPCLLDEIYNKLGDKNGLTQEERKFIVQEHHANKRLDSTSVGIDIMGKIVDITVDVFENSSCYSK